tara:strand:- start:2555 stop:2749 length:195 start_codon:yes stop_codon:yes gene_type:complete
MNLTKRQLKTIKIIGRWADGSCTHSKAKVTGAQLVKLGLAEYWNDAIILTARGKFINNGDSNNE